MKDETPRRTMLPSRLPADEEKSEVSFICYRSSSKFLSRLLQARLHLETVLLVRWSVDRSQLYTNTLIHNIS